MPEHRNRRPSRVLPLARRIPTIVYGLVIVALLVGVVAASGGLATVEDEPVARSGISRTVTGKQFNVTVEAA